MYKKTASLSKHLDFLLFDLVFFALSYAIGYVIRFGFKKVEYLGDAPLRFGIVLMILYLVVAFFTRAYRDILHRNKWTELIKVFVQVVVTMVAFLMYLYLTKQSTILSRLMFGYMAIAALVLLTCERLVYKNILRSHFHNNPKLSHMVLVANESHVENCLNAFKGQRFNDFYLSGIVIFGDKTGELKVNELCEYGDFRKYVLSNVVDQVMIAVDDESERLALAEYLIEAGIVVHLSLEDMSIELPHAMAEEIGGRKVMTFSNNVAGSISLLLKRLIDIIGGFVGLIITGILYLIIAPQIKHKDPGPAFFKQKRVGKNGRIFHIYKFRSMYMDAEERKKELMTQNEMQGLMFKIEDDPRILPGIGHKIRDWSLDEFPQFLNVFKGDMSLVGTRPPTVDEYNQYQAHHKSRLSFKPGITGMWQVSGRSSITDFEEIVRLDNEYIQNWSLWLDVKIIVKTVGVVLGRKGSM